MARIPHRRSGILYVDITARSRKRSPGNLLVFPVLVLASAGTKCSRGRLPESCVLHLKAVGTMHLRLCFGLRVCIGRQTDTVAALTLSALFGQWGYRLS